MIKQRIATAAKKLRDWMDKPDLKFERYQFVVAAEPDAYREGIQAAERSRRIEALNPYLPGTVKHDAWQSGWNDEMQTQWSW